DYETNPLEVFSQHGRKTIFLRDTDGDDVADESTTLIEGWGLGDTHGGVSNFRYGLDNWIWAMQGYNNSTPKYAGKQSQSFRQGFWRFKLSKSNPPKVTDLEFIRSSDNNTWGLGISEEGLVFGSTANRNPSMFVTIPNRYYERVRGWAPATLHSIADNHLFEPITENVRQVDQHGGYTAAAGHALYTARAFPKQWWNKTAFVCGPTGHLVGTFVLRRDGANYKSTSPVNLLASTDEWSAPIMAEVGPDGAVWVIDWYNFIVQHNPTPHGFKTGKGAAYESDLRDKKHGRIYRVVASEDGRSKQHKFASLADASNLELVAQLAHPSFNWRLQAQRLLVEREAIDAAAALWKLLDDESVDEIGLNVGAIHALHTLNELGQLDVGDQSDATDATIGKLTQALQHPSAGVRRNALAVLPSNSIGLSLLLQNRQLFEDVDVQVKLQAILTLSDMPESSDAAELGVALAATSTDPVLIDALTSAAAAHAVDFLRQTLAVKAPSPALLSISPRVAEHIARSGLTTDKLQRVVSSLSTADAALAAATIDGLAGGMPATSNIASNKMLDQALVQAFQSAGGQLKGKLLQLTGRAGIDSLDAFSAEVVERLVSVIEDESALAAARASAAVDLITLRPQSEEAVATIVDQLTPQLPLDVAKGMLDSLNASSSKSGGEVVVEQLPSLTPAMRSLTVAVVLTKPAWVDSLLKAAENKGFDLSDLVLAQKQSLRSFPDRKLRTRAEKLLAESGGLPDADREKVLQSLMHLTEESGKVEAGKAVFKKVCAACHQHGELGFEIGPNLTGMAVHPKEELLTHIIDPSRNVEGNFRLYKVLTVDDKVINGMLAGETRTSVTIIDSEAKKTTLPREDIVNLIASRKSVMPEGFEKQITEPELVDLLEFLTDKGPYLPLPLDKVATAISTKGLFGGGDSGPDRMVFSDWKPKVFKGVPFVLTNPNGKTRPNMILLHGPNSASSAKMPKSVELPFSDAASAIHLLSGVGGWNFPYDSSKTVSMIVRLTYEDETVEDHGLVNGVHFADYIRRSDVAGSEFAFALGNQQIRYLRVEPKLSKVIKKIELVKGEDNSAPMVMAVTVERRSK
ncbi:MAG: PVC-type heme-binding CxxCH protein, partial [Planctomycetota bacterium]